MLGIMRAAHFNGFSLWLLKMTVRMCFIFDSCSWHEAGKCHNIQIVLFHSLISWWMTGSTGLSRRKNADKTILSLCLYQLKPNHTVVVLNKWSTWSKTIRGWLIFRETLEKKIFLNERKIAAWSTFLAE